jgi:hypothetical protein
MADVKGWWSVSISLKTLKELEKIRKEMLDELGIEYLSYNSVINRLIEFYKNHKYKDSY